jgi:hypothetical protein
LAEIVPDPDSDQDREKSVPKLVSTIEVLRSRVFLNFRSLRFTNLKASQLSTLPPVGMAKTEKAI